MKEFWKTKCKDDLFNLRKNEAAILSLPEDIENERSKMTSIKSASAGAAPVQGGGTSYEQRLNDSICKIDEMTKNLHHAEKDIKLTRQALATLTNEERRILEVLYIDRQKRGAERLCQELAIAEEATVWKRAMQALGNYCAARYSSAAL